MKKYKDEDIQKAKDLRHKEGYSFAQLQRITGIPATTIRNWCEDDFLGTRWDTLLRTNERKRRELKDSEAGTLESLKRINKDGAKIFASLIYWCEGSKYPATNKVELTNSDPNLMKLFVNLFRKAFDLDETKFRIHLQIHDVHNFEELKSFWGNLLGIPSGRFIKPTVTKMKGGKHRKNYLGTCTVRYHDFRIQLKLTGIYEKLTDKIGEIS